jgi:hypothetical protein
VDTNACAQTYPLAGCSRSSSYDAASCSDRSYTAADPEYSVRARARVRHLATRRRRVIGKHKPEQYALALAGLVTALGLTPYLYPPDMSATALHQKLSDLVYGLQDPTIRDVTTAVAG